MELFHFLAAVYDTWLTNFTVDFTTEAKRYVIGAVGIWLLIWVILKNPLASRKIRKSLPSRLLRKQVIREVRNSLITMVVFTVCFSITHELMQTFAGGSMFKIYDNVSDYGWPYLIFSVVLWSIGLDTYFYWTHRFMHLPRFYAFFHRTHHRSHNPTPFTAYSFAPPEAVLVYIFAPIFFILVPMHHTAFVAAMLIQIIRNAMAHCGYELFPRGWAQHPVLGIFATVTHHDLHHEKSNGNYGFYFTFWDRIMGTEHPEYVQRFEQATNPELKMSMQAKSKRSELSHQHSA